MNWGDDRVERLDRLGQGGGYRGPARAKPPGGASARDRAYISGRTIRISITAAAFEAIAATLRFGSVGFEREPDANGERQLWLEPRILDRL